MISRIEDPRLLEIYEQRTAAGLPADLTNVAHRKARMVLAAQDLSDIFSPIAELPDGQLAIAVLNKWVLTFHWVPGEGARDLALKRV